MEQGEGGLSLGKSRTSLRKQKEGLDAGFPGFSIGVFMEEPEQMIRTHSGDS